MKIIFFDCHTCVFVCCFCFRIVLLYYVCERHDSQSCISLKKYKPDQNRNAQTEQCQLCQQVLVVAKQYNFVPRAGYQTIFVALQPLS